jgi:hypothetical protein
VARIARHGITPGGRPRPRPFTAPGPAVGAEVFSDTQADALYKQLQAVLGKYRRSLQSDRRHLLEQFAMVQLARKVVGLAAPAPASGSC